MIISLVAQEERRQDVCKSGVGVTKLTTNKCVGLLEFTLAPSKQVASCVGGDLAIVVGNLVRVSAITARGKVPWRTNELGLQLKREGTKFQLVMADGIVLVNK